MKKFKKPIDGSDLRLTAIDCAKKILKIEGRIKELHKRSASLLDFLRATREAQGLANNASVLLGHSDDGDEIRLVDNFASSNLCFRAAAVRRIEVVKFKPTSKRKR